MGSRSHIVMLLGRQARGIGLLPNRRGGHRWRFLLNLGLEICGPSGRTLTALPQDHQDDHGDATSGGYIKRIQTTPYNPSRLLETWSKLPCWRTVRDRCMGASSVSMATRSTCQENWSELITCCSGENSSRPPVQAPPGAAPRPPMTTTAGRRSDELRAMEDELRDPSNFLEYLLPRPVREITIVLDGTE